MLFGSSKRCETPRRVVITGAGVITALGIGWKENATGLRHGKTAFGQVSLFDVSRQRVKTAAQIELPGDLPSTHLSPRHQQRMERSGKMLLWAAHEAWRQAGWTPGEYIPIVLGTTSGGMALGQDYYRHASDSPKTHRSQPTRVTYYQGQRQALDLCEAFRFSGPIILIANACASGANAIGHAFDLVRFNRAERVLTGGYDALSHLVFSGFDSLQALSPTRCRPFDSHRDGLALGEGAAVLTVESLEHAMRRGATILAEVAAYGSATDIHHLTQPHPNGNAALASMCEATEAARITPEDVGYINAHGTGTPLNDVSEAAAINRWAGTHAANLPVSSTKSSIGHTLGAAGAIEAVYCVMALQEQWLPGTPSMETPDPICQFPVLREAVERKLEYALTNSFGFGGANATLILRRWP